MGAPDILNVLHGMGLRLSAHGTELHVGPRTALTDDTRRLIRDHKTELLAALRQSSDFGMAEGKRVQPTDCDTLPDQAAEVRRQRVLAILASNPALRLAVVCDAEGDPVPVAVAIRGKGTCEVLIPAPKFEPLALLDLVSRYGATLH